MPVVSYAPPPLCKQVGHTALIMATVAGNFDIAQELVRHGANVNAKDHVRVNAPRGVALLLIRVY